MSKIKVVLIGGEYDLTRMLIEDRGHGFLEMMGRLDPYPILFSRMTELPTEAVCKVLHYRKTYKVCGDTWIYEYHPHE